jgi:transcription elongation factor GreA
MDKIPMTAAGYSVLETELKKRQQVERPRIIQQITDARSHGDLSENAEYHAAREHQGFIEGRIKEIESRLANSEVIDVSKLPQTGKVVFGVTVELEAQDDGARVKYQIVGEDEADIRQGMIAVTSPIARALVSKQQGDVVEVQAPGGVRSYEIVTVRYQ